MLVSRYTLIKDKSLSLSWVIYEFLILLFAFIHHPCLNSSLTVVWFCVCGSSVMDWSLVQDVPLLWLSVSWNRVHTAPPACDPELDKHLRRWMDGQCGISQTFFADNSLQMVRKVMEGTEIEPKIPNWVLSLWGIVLILICYSLD